MRILSVYSVFLLWKLACTSGLLEESISEKFVYLNEQDFDRFPGNESFTDYFKLLLIENSNALIGARNVMFNISLSDLAEISKTRISWSPGTSDTDLCHLKGKPEDDCQNFIRVAAKVNEDEILLCGTNAYKPSCRTYRYNEDNILEHVKQEPGVGIVPFSPEWNTTALYTDGHLFTATPSDFSGRKPLIFRGSLQTDVSDLTQLNNPNFVGSIAHNSYVLFFFREEAVEYINCGKVVYSRVARVCKKDKGGPRHLSGKWSSFMKARLNCSVPGDYPFYFNEIQATSDVVNGVYKSERVELIYGIFTTPENSIHGSAVCAFRLDDIYRTFDGSFKGQEAIDSNWLPVRPSKVPNPRPGRCVNDSRTLLEPSVSFLINHPLMDGTVSSFSSPVVINISFKSQFTTIAVDPQVQTLTGPKIDVLFIGTADGRVLKTVHLPHERPSPPYTEELVIPNNKAAIMSLTIARLPEGPKLIVVTNEDVFSIPLQRCSKKIFCSSCVESQDPYCAWNKDLSRCESYPFSGPRERYIQNITNGTNLCTKLGFPDRSEVDDLNKIPDPEQDGNKGCHKCSPCPSTCVNEGPQVAKSTENIYSPGALVMAVTSSGLVTLCFGFLAGYCCSRYFRPTNEYSNMPLHTSTRHNRLNDPNVEGGASYLSACANNKQAINLVKNVSPKNFNDKNANTSTDNNKTLQKVKKTYI